MKDYRRLVFRRPEEALIQEKAAELTTNEKTEQELNVKQLDSPYKIMFFDEFVERLLTADRFCDVNLPRMC